MSKVNENKKNVVLIIVKRNMSVWLTTNGYKTNSSEQKKKWFCYKAMSPHVKYKNTD